MSSPTISITVCTYRRPAQLRTLIARLAAQETLPVHELIVVDNDVSGSSRETVESAEAPFPIRYAIEPEKNLSLARNRGISLVRGEWVAILDDDELPVTGWLRYLWQTASRYGADVVLAPVLTTPPADAPAWILQGDFYGRRRFPTGTAVPRNEFRIGNALVRRAALEPLDGPFSPELGLGGRGDAAMLCRLADRGARIIWCDEAVVTEPVEPARLSQQWLLRRAFRTGNDYGWHFLDGHFGRPTPVRRAAFVGRAALQFVVALGLAGVCLPFGRARRVHWLRKAWSNAGKLSAFTGRIEEEYRIPRPAAAADRGTG